MKSVGQGVFELRQADSLGWRRIIYLSRIDGKIYMLHSFVKKSAKTSSRDLGIAANRLKVVQARRLKEKRDAKKDK